MLDFQSKDAHTTSDPFQAFLARGEALIKAGRQELEASQASCWFKDVQTFFAEGQPSDHAQKQGATDGSKENGTGPLKYRYKPLLTDEIRVLHISPSKNPNDPLICRLGATPIITDYHIALSYAWGPTFTDGSHLTESLTIDGLPFLVTKHLFQALKRIRQHASDLYLFRKTIRIWVDAICINQESIEERSQQVSKMGEIYLRCEKLIIWLGEMDSVERRDGTMLERFLECSWFQRRWVIQEYALAPAGQRYFLSGRYGLMDSEKVYGSLKASGLLSYAGAIQDVDKPMVDLLDHLHRYSTAQCSVPHDRIYAFLDINAIRQDTDEVSKRLKVDYNQSVRDLYIEMATAEVEYRPQNVPALLASAVVRQHGASDELPSWVPDWRAESRYAFPEQYEAVERCFADERALLYGRVSGSELHLKNVTTLRPCFPPQHESSSTCACCRLCADLWILSSTSMKITLQHFAKDGLMLVNEACGIVFLLSARSTSNHRAGQWVLKSCFAIEEFKMMPDLSAHRREQLVITGVDEASSESLILAQAARKRIEAKLPPPPVPPKPLTMSIPRRAGVVGAVGYRPQVPTPSTLH